MFLGVALGAFGAHALAPTLQAHGTEAVWRTATLYHLIHGLALWLPASQKSKAYWCFLTGIVLFSGSLYVLAGMNMRFLGAVTPFGGLFFLAGWALLTMSAKN